MEKELTKSNLFVGFKSIVMCSKKPVLIPNEGETIESKLPNGKTRKDKKLTLHITEKGYTKLLQQLGKVVK